MKINFNIFISHDKSDETIALALKVFLENIFKNSNIYVSERDIMGGQKWIENIKLSLKTSHVIISIISKKSLESEWLYFETGAGFVDDKLIPLVVGKVTLRNLKPPLSLLQARLLSKNGIVALVNDIVLILNLRAPKHLNGIDRLIKVSEDLLKLVPKKIIKPEVPKRTVKIVNKVVEICVDPEIQSKFNSAYQRFTALVLRKILSTKNIDGLPSKRELKGLDQSELFKVASAFNIPRPSMVLIQLLSLNGNMPNTDAKGWEKMKALKTIESTQLEMDKYENLI